MNLLNKIAALFFIVFLGACASQKGVTSGTLSKDKRILFEQHYFDGSTQKIINNKDKAIDFFLQALEVHPASHESMYQLGNLYFQKKSLTEALAYSEMAVANNPKFNHWYSGQLAQLYNRLGMYEKAGQEFERMMQEEPEIEDNYIEASNQYLNLDNPQKAIEILDKLQENNGISEEAIRRLDYIYSRLGMPEKGEAEIMKLIDRSPDDIGYRGLLADHFINIGESTKAIGALEDIIEIDPSLGYPRFMLYEIYRNEGKDEQAFEYLLESFSFSDIGIDRKLQSVTGYFLRIGSDTSSLSKLEKLSEALMLAHSTTPEPYVLKSDIALQKKDYQQAREMVLLALEKDNSDYQVWTKLLYVDGKIGNVKGQPRYQIEDSKKAIALFPNLPEFYIANAYANIEYKEFDEALKVVKDGLEIALEKPDKIQLMLAEASAHEGKNDIGLMTASYDNALALNPYYPITLNNYAYSLSNIEMQLPKADSLIDLALSIERGNPNYMDTKGWILFKQKKYEEAADWILKAINIDPRATEFYDHIIEVFNASGELEKANEWKQAKEGLK